MSETLKQILERPWNGGTRIINCILHTGPIDGRPHTCELCHTDLENQFRYALRVNEFLNKKVDDALAVIEKE